LLTVKKARTTKKGTTFMHPLKTARELRGWSQVKLAETIGTTPRNVSRWEQGLTVPHPYYREQLCVLFEQDARELGLLRDTDQYIPDTQPSPPPPIHQQTPLLIDPAIPALVGGNMSLLGRDQLLAHIKHALQEHANSAVALHGLPGMGKTSLAVVLSTEQDVLETFQDGILWAGLGLQPDVHSHLLRWGQLLGIEPQQLEQHKQMDSLSQLLRRVIGQRRLLLIIDDAWSVEDALALRIGGTQCVHLLTTRFSQLAFLFANTYTISVPALNDSDGLALLARFVPDLVQQDHANMIALVQEVGASPLAITLMGKYLALQTFSGQPRRVRTALKQLRNAQDRLQLAFPVSTSERSPHLAPNIPLSLHSTISVSAQHVGQRAQEVLSTLSILPNKPESFLEEIALAVSGASIEILDILWDAGLLESAAPGRYTLHQTISDYAQIQANPCHLVQARKRLVTFLVPYVQTHAQNYEMLEREKSTIVVALDAAITLKIDQALRQLILACSNFMRVRGYYHTAENYLQQALLTITSAETTSPELIEEQLLLIHHLATFVELRGNYRQARDYCHQGLVLAKQLKLSNVERDLLTTLGLVAFQQADYKQARKMFGNALSTAKQHSEQEQIAMLCGYLGRVAYMQGQTLLAENYYQEGMIQARHAGTREIISRLLAHLGAVSVRQGNYVRAEQLFQEGLSLERYQQHLPLLEQQGDLESLAWLLQNWGSLLRSQGHYAQADAHYQEIMALGYRSGRDSELCMSLTDQGQLALAQGDPEQAIRYLQEGIDLAQRIGNRCYLPALLTTLGTARGLQGGHEQANALFQKSVRLSQQYHAYWDLLYGLVSWGEFHLVSQHWEEARQRFLEGMQLEESAKIDLFLFTRAQYGLAQVAKHNGTYETEGHISAF
jgi:tetratricopeptide (TPR) repeat protein/transcriptional regulator with XRE-family HTH domain